MSVIQVTTNKGEIFKFTNEVEHNCYWILADENNQPVYGDRRDPEFGRTYIYEVDHISYITTQKDVSSLCYAIRTSEVFVGTVKNFKVDVQGKIVDFEVLS